MAIITDDWHLKVKGAKIRCIFPLQRQNCFVFWRIFVHHIIGKENCWFRFRWKWRWVHEELWTHQTPGKDMWRTFSKTPPWIRPPPTDFFLMSSAGIKLMIRGTSWTDLFATNWQLKDPNKQIRQTSEIIWSTFAISDLLKAENLLKSNLQQVMLKFTIDYDLGLYFLSFSRMTSTSGKSAAGILCSSCSFK